MIAISRIFMLALVLLPVALGCSSDVDPLDVDTKLSGSLEGRNVVIMVADSLQAGHVSCYGYERRTSPAIDQAAAEGVRFEHAYSQTSWTLSSVATLFTALEQERHGLLRVDETLGQVPTTLAELFQRKGYRTIALMQNEVIRAETGLDRGFDLYKFYPYDHGSTGRFLDFARKVLLGDLKKPFFLYLHLMPPHGPYTPPDPYQDRFDSDYTGPVTGSIDDCVMVQKKKSGPDDPDVVHLAALYDAYIYWIDSQIGELLAAVRDAGRAERFLFVISSDHGEAFMEHGKQGHNAHVFEEMVRVPLILQAPGGPFREGSVIDAPVSLIDLLPTLSDLLNLPPPRQDLDGVSLVPLLEDLNPISDPDRPLFFTSRYKKKDNLERLQLGMRLGRYKLVLTGLKGQAELFDLEKDPKELKNLFDSSGPAGREMEKALRDWYARVSTDRAYWDGRQTVPLSEDLKRRLEALGYTGE